MTWLVGAKHFSTVVPSKNASPLLVDQFIDLLHNSGEVTSVSDQVTLSAYADEIRELIKHDRNDEAIAICKHILRFYPKHIDSARQMAEALLEKGDLDGAQDLFRRVLSADPENVIAYVGLAAIFEEKQLMDEALWHMERAFELSPSHSEIHRELLRLHGINTPRQKARLKLTPGALARLYAHQGLLAQATQELRALVAGDPTRLDARTALAEMLWRTGHIHEAAQVAQDLLSPLPYCLKANLILGTAWKESGLPESEAYLQRAQSLDPASKLAQNLLGARAPFALADPTVPRFVEGTSPAPMIERIAPVETPIAFEEPAAPIEEPIALSEAAPEERIEIGPTPKPDLPVTSLPPWLRRDVTDATALTDLAALPPVKPAVAQEGTTLPPWISPTQETRVEEPVASQDAWTREIETETRVEEPVASQDAWTREIETETRVEEPVASQDAWTRELETRVEEPVASQDAWTRELETRVEEPVASQDAWTRELETEPRVEEPVASQDAWTRELETEPRVEEPVASQESREREIETRIEEPVASLESWARQIETEAVAPEARAAESAEELPAWMTQLQEPAIAAPDARAEKSSDELPAWLSQDQPSAPRVEEPVASLDSETMQTQEPEAAAPFVIAPEEEKPFAREEPPIETPAEPLPAETIRAEESLSERFARWRAAREAVVEPRAEIAPEARAEISEPAPPVVEPAPPSARAPQPPRQPKGYSHLAKAREHRDANRAEDALREYAWVIQHAPRLVGEVVSDLEALVRRAGVPHDAHRVLGDAYTRVGRLADALERYRFLYDRVSESPAS
jgi:tetratricopeptide (TPR) repeat protein